MKIFKNLLGRFSQLKKINNHDKPTEKEQALRHSVGGSIGFYNLEEWWETTFTAEEQNYLISAYKPLGMKDTELVSGNILSSTMTKAGFLRSFASFVSSDQDNSFNQEIANHILLKAEETALLENDYLNLHFSYQEEIKSNYKHRGQVEGALDKAIHACEKQIKISFEVAIAFANTVSLGRTVRESHFFNINIDFEKELEKQCISESLKSEFEQKGVFLSDASVAFPVEDSKQTQNALYAEYPSDIQKTKSEWIIADSKNKLIYLLVNKGSKISVCTLSFPIHTGYRQLAIILEKQGNFLDAIGLSKEAKLEGWGDREAYDPGIWQNRIDRLKKKLASQKD